MRVLLTLLFLSDIKACFKKLKYEPNCRAVVVSGKGKIFTAGLDLTQLSNVIMGNQDEESSDDVGRRGFRIKQILEDFQESLTSIELVRKTHQKYYLDVVDWLFFFFKVS